MLPKGPHLLRPNLKRERNLAQVAPKVDKQASPNGRVPIRTQTSPRKRIPKSPRRQKGKSKATITKESVSIATVSDIGREIVQSTSLN